MIRRLIVPEIRVMVFAIKLIIIHITLINVQFRYINVDAEKAPQSGNTKEENQMRKIGRFGFAIKYSRKQICFDLLGVFYGRYGDAIGQNPFVLLTCIVRERPPAAEREVRWRCCELWRSETRRCGGILEPIEKRKKRNQ